MHQAGSDSLLTEQVFYGGGDSLAVDAVFVPPLLLPSF